MVLFVIGKSKNPHTNPYNAYGTGVFEGVRAYETETGPAIFRLVDHTDRLFESADLVGMNIPFTKDQLMQHNVIVLLKIILKMHI